MNFKKSSPDGIDRRGFLNCMRWAGTGLLWSMTGGVGASRMLSGEEFRSGRQSAADGFSFVQISDSHMGFNKPANQDVAGTFKAAIDRINALPGRPSFIVHTGDVSHLSRAQEFDQVQQMMAAAKISQHYFIPGEHDVVENNGKDFLDRFGKSTKGNGWYSFDVNGMHFIALINVLETKAGGLGHLGREQLEWVEADLKGQASSTPIVVFAHVPLWTVYQEWGWGTEDGAQVLSYLRRFGSVSILNGHIHQNVQKVEGNLFFHTADSTAFPQPKPGSALSPGPLKVPSEQLRSMLGLTSVSYVPGRDALAVTDLTLAVPASAEASIANIKIDNFNFNPSSINVAAGTEVVWTNHDDMPHTIVSDDRKFKSPVLDADQMFSFRFTDPGVYPYFCSIHPKMTGKVVVNG